MPSRLKPAPRPPRTSPGASRVVAALARAHPDATCALRYRSPFELAVATILSAQCTDRRVNEVTPALFERFPTAAELAGAEPSELETLIRSTGFFRAKARSLIGCAQALIRDHGGEMPRSMEALTRLPGVGRKTANVILGHAFGISEGLAVDTHVLRVANRLGLAHAQDPEEVERQLTAQLPRDLWTRTSDVLIFHGRRICKAQRPDCGICPVFDRCAWPERQAFAHADAAPRRGSGSKAAPRARPPGKRPAPSER